MIIQHKYSISYGWSKLIKLNPWAILHFYHADEIQILQSVIDQLKISSENLDIELLVARDNILSWIRVDIVHVQFIKWQVNTIDLGNIADILQIGEASEFRESQFCNLRIE